MNKLKILLVISLLGFYPLVENSICPDRVIFLDVKQGDSALIQHECRNILIDGGPGNYVLSKLGSYLKPWERKIDIVIVSHPHLDHISGIVDIVKRYNVGELWINPVCYNSSAYKELLVISQKVVKVDNSVNLGTQDFQIKVLHPFGKEVKLVEKCEGSGTVQSIDQNINNDSIVIQLNFRGKVFLFTGDGEHELEARLVAEGFVSDIDVLKAGHHCSNTSSGKEFLSVIKPELVICSFAEKNRYGHPGKETISRFEEMGIKYIFLYESGDYIVIIS